MSPQELKRIPRAGSLALSTGLRARMPERVNGAVALRVLAWFSFGTAVALIPFRYRIELLPRPYPPIYADYTNFQLYASDIFLILTLVFWLIVLGWQPRPIAWGPTFITLPLLSFPAIGLLTSWNSVDPALSLYHTARLALLFGLYLYILNEITSIRILAVPVAVQLLVQSLVAIVQGLKQASIGLAMFGELELDPAWSGVSVVWGEGIRLLRAYGLADHPNILGGCLALALIVTAVWYLETKSRWRTAAVSLFSLGSLALMLTFSRSAWLGFALGFLFVFVFLFKTRQTRHILALGNLSFAAALLVLPFAWANLPYLGTRLNAGGSFSSVGSEIQSLGERKILNTAANQIFAENAITGIGLGALPTAMRTYYPDFAIHYQPAHFVLINVAAETGIFAGLIYLIWLLAPWLGLWLNRNRLVFSPLLIGASALLLVITVISLFDYYPWLLAPGRFWHWLAWGWWATVYRSALRGGET